MNLRIAVVGAALLFFVSACSLLPAAQQEAPTPCDQIYSNDRCLAMVDLGAAEISRNRADVRAIEIVPYPPPAADVLENRSGRRPIKVRITLLDGTSRGTQMCGGIPSGPACTDSPRLEAFSVVGPSGGYRDVPCGGDPPTDCPTPFPALDPDAVAEAEAVTLDQKLIAIDREGSFEVVLGVGSLRNGILTTASLEFTQVWPDDIALRDGRAWIEVRSLERDGKPFDNYYLHGWRPGVERIQAVVTFEVLWFDPGATLEVRNVVVR